MNIKVEFYDKNQLLNNFLYTNSNFLKNLEDNEKDNEILIPFDLPLEINNCDDLINYFHSCDYLYINTFDKKIINLLDNKDYDNAFKFLLKQRKILWFNNILFKDFKTVLTDEKIDDLNNYELKVIIKLLTDNPIDIEEVNVEHLTQTYYYCSLFINFKLTCYYNFKLVSQNNDKHFLYFQYSYSKVLHIVKYYNRNPNTVFVVKNINFVLPHNRFSPKLLEYIIKIYITRGLYEVVSKIYEHYIDDKYNEKHRIYRVLTEDIFIDKIFKINDTYDKKLFLILSKYNFLIKYNIAVHLVKILDAKTIIDLSLIHI